MPESLLQEGVAMDQQNNKDLVKLLRYASSANENDQLISLQEYVDRYVYEHMYMHIDR
jgi:HSP90 family molecular chaperone